MAELAQAYIHLKPFSVPGDSDEFGTRVTQGAREAALGIYEFPVILNVTIQEGSAKIWATILATYSAIAIYPDFKQGAAELYRDGKIFSDAAIQNIKSNIKPPESAIYRSERRTRDAGRIFRLQQRLEKLHRSKNQLSESSYDEECAQIMKEFERIISRFDDKEAEFLRSQFHFDSKGADGRGRSSRRKVDEQQIELMALSDDLLIATDRTIYRKSVLVMPKGWLSANESGLIEVE